MPLGHSAGKVKGVYPLNPPGEPMSNNEPAPALGVASYERPIRGRLVVVLDNGEQWDATPADLEQFGAVKRLDAYLNFIRHLRNILHAAGLLDGDLTDTALNPIRYLVELAVMNPDLLTHPETAEHDADVVAIERTLRAAGVARG